MSRVWRRWSERAEAGVSYIEVIITVAVMGILTSLVIPAYGGVQGEARQAAVDSSVTSAYADATAALDGLGMGTSDPAKAHAALAAQRSGSIDLQFVGTNGRIIPEGSPVDGNLCVWAYDRGDVVDSRAKYSALEGDCPAPTVRLTVPHASTGIPTLLSKEDASYPNAVFVLNCPTATTWTPPITGFTGTQLWSDGLRQEGAATRALEANKNYVVEFQGPYSSTRSLDRTYTELCLREVRSWGADSGVTSLVYGGYGSLNLTVVAEPPRTVTNLTLFLSGTTAKPKTVALTSDLSTWDLSNVTTIERMLMDNRNFNQDLSKWNTSNITNMEGFLARANAYRRDLSMWNVAKVRSYNHFLLSVTGYNSSYLPKFR